MNIFEAKRSKLALRIVAGLHLCFVRTNGSVIDSFFKSVAIGCPLKFRRVIAQAPSVFAPSSKSCGRHYNMVHKRGPRNPKSREFRRIK